jgi:glycosyltransferase involved in cell wall biosynthesis
MLTPKVSVIIPIYKVEKYIEKCARSLFEQTLNEIEYIFVNDCTPDDSINVLNEIIKEYPNRQSWIKIIHHDKNRGLTSTRNTGISIAYGEYITHCDSDDWIEHDMYEKMYMCAKSTSADVVYCDINMVFENYSEIYKAAVNTTNKNDFLRNYIASVWTSLCNTLISTEIYKKYGLYSPEHLCYCEDFWLSVRLFHYANKISYIDNPFYNYNRSNGGSIVHSLNRKTELDERKAYLETIAFFNKEGVENEYKREMSWRILKSTHDSALYRSRYNEFLTIYPESHKFIWSCPYVNFKCKCIMSLLRFRLLRPFGVMLISIRDFIKNKICSIQQ